MSKKRVVILCEGDTEYELVIHIKNILHSKKKVKVRNNHGESYEGMKSKRNNLLQNREYEKVYIVVDRDEKQIDDDENLILAKPCLEGELLKVLNVKVGTIGSKPCKKKFQSEFLGGRYKVADYKSYFKKHFTLEVLDSNKNKSPWLNKIIKIFE